MLVTKLCDIDSLGLVRVAILPVPSSVLSHESKV